jgi:hypothetical protein
MLSSWGTAIKLMALYIPNTELVRPINHNGATDRGFIVPFSESMNGEQQPGDVPVE